MPIAKKNLALILNFVKYCFEYGVVSYATDLLSKVSYATNLNHVRSLRAALLRALYFQQK